MKWNKFYPCLLFFSCLFITHVLGCFPPYRSGWADFTQFPRSISISLSIECVKLLSWNPRRQESTSLATKKRRGPGGEKDFVTLWNSCHVFWAFHKQISLMSEKKHYQLALKKQTVRKRYKSGKAYSLKGTWITTVSSWSKSVWQDLGQKWGRPGKGKTWH